MLGAEDEVGVKRGSVTHADGVNEVEKLAGALQFDRVKKHGGGEVEDEIDGRADFLAVLLHGVGARAGVGLPVDVAWVIARDVIAVVLKVE